MVSPGASSSPAAAAHLADSAWRARVDEVRAVAGDELVELARSGTEGRVNRPLLAAMARHGLLEALFPGAAAGKPTGQVAATELCCLREGLASVSTEAETALALQGLGGYPILQGGSTALVQEWVPAIARGEAVAAFALSEPGAGSDAAQLALRAEPFGEGWRLFGEKLWISNAPEADVYTIFARTTPGSGARGVTAFALPAERPGCTGEPLELLAPHAIGRLLLDGVEVGPDDVLGEVDRGFGVAMTTLDLFRPSVGAFAVGMARAALDAAVSFTQEREAFGGRLSDLEAVAHSLADMATELEAARLLVRAAATAYDAGATRHAVTRASAMAKVFATEAAQRIIDRALQLHGARGLVRGHLLEHLYREVRATRIYEGASEVQRTIIARELLR